MNMVDKPRAIFVGPEQLGKMLSIHRQDLDFVSICKDIDALHAGLESGEISNEIEVIITIDKFFDPKDNTENTQFEEMVATFSPYCLMMIIQYNPSVENLLRERIKAAAIAVDEPGNEEFYFVSPNKPHPDIDNAKTKFIRNNPDSEISYVLQGLDKDNMPEEEEHDFIPGVDNVEFSEDEFDEEDDTPGNGKVITITSAKGGVGTTTIATLLTTYISHASYNAAEESKKNGDPLKICLLELNIRNGQLGFIIGSLQPSILKMRSDGVNSATLEETVIKSESLKADCIILPKKSKLSENLTLEFIIDVLEFLKKKYDYIIVDTSYSYVGTEMELLEKVVYPKSDLIVYVTNCSMSSLLSMTRWVESARAPISKDGMNLPMNKVGIVLNDFIKDMNIEGDEVTKLARGQSIITVVPSNKKLAIKATNQHAIPAMLKNDSFRESIKTLAYSIVGEEHPLSQRIF